MLKYDGLAEVIAANQGLPDFLIQTSKVRTRTSAYEERSSAVHLLPLEIDLAGVNDMRVVYDNLMHLKENIAMHPAASINLITSCEGLLCTLLQAST
ncbi:hypothetical protein QE152_g16029 [Popillia japonica]|uniref:Uncharacterized protein n=1 Tax=Popillia japonica TaxID=7064 RepID=A0AAW1L3P8_POPJA